MDVPVIHTDRLILRPHRLGDFDALADMWADPVVARFIGGKPSTRDESWARLLRYVGHWPLMGFGYWAVESREGGQYLGDVGFADWHRVITPSILGIPEAGWVLATAAHGRGIATEAVQAAVGWADRHFGDRVTTCIIGVENQASVRVALKCGYREHGLSDFKGSSVMQFRRPPGA
jgi:RimJ/RimL family protein N-acetyltransferase